MNGRSFRRSAKERVPSGGIHINIEMKLPAQVQKALAMLEKAGYESYTVGGCVRDTLMGRAPDDYDITTAARPEQVNACFAGEHVIPTGVKHGTLTVVLDGMPLEITTFRADGKYSDHRRPDAVSFSDRLDADLCRRDFTINAMAYSPKRGLVDLYGGMEDIRRRRVRCVGEAERRFAEDALRMLRAVRFAAALGFDIALATLDALEARRADIRYVARERVFAELDKAVCAAKPRPAFEKGKRIVILALGGESSDIPPSQWESYGRMYAEALALMERVRPEQALRWAALLCPLGAEAAGRVLVGLRAPNSVIDRTCAAIRGSEGDFAPEKADILRKLNAMGRRGMSEALELAAARAAIAGDLPRAQLMADLQSRSEALITGGACWSLKTLAIGGKELGRIGFSGRSIGSALALLLEMVMDDKIPNEAEALKACAVRIYDSQDGIQQL